MRIPLRLMWGMIGDFFNDHIEEKERRTVEAVWQGMADNAADVLRYVDFYKRSKNIFEVEPFAPYGKFYAEAYLSSAELDVEGQVLGYRNGYWFVYTEDDISPLENTGYFKLFSSSIYYSQYTAQALLSGGHILKLKSDYATEDWDAIDNPSIIFDENYTDRFESIGSRDPVGGDGLEMNPEWVNQIILRDKYYMDGGQDWTQLWRIKVTDWDPTDTKRSLSVNVFGDSGPSYEVRVGEDVSMGKYAYTKGYTLSFSTYDITRTRGNWIRDGFEVGMEIELVGTSSDGMYTVTGVTSTVLTLDSTLVTETVSSAVVRNNLTPASGSTFFWGSVLESASEDNPVYIEIEVRYKASAKTLFSKVWLNEYSVEQAAPYLVAPGRKRVVFDFFNQYKSATAVIEFMYSNASVWDSTNSLDFSTQVGSSYSYTYRLEEPIVDGSVIRSMPWDLKANGEVLIYDGNEISIEVNERFEQYAPEFARIENDDGDYAVCELTSQNGDVATYRVVRTSSPSISFPGVSYLRPWFTTDFEFVDAGFFRTSKEMPTTNVWIIDAEGREVDLYERYGKLLKMPKREDSWEYLHSLRGMQYGLLSSATPGKFSRAAGAMVGLPYSTRSGVLRSVNRVTNELGGAQFDEVSVGGRIIEIDPWWSDNGLLKKTGSYIPFMGSIVRGVDIHDWVSNPELIRSRAGYWAQWSTFIVQIPAHVGINQQHAADLIRMFRRSKSVHTDFLMEYKIDLEEDTPYEFDRSRFSQRERIVSEQFAHTVEDLTFDDYGSVHGQDMKYQSVGGSDFSEEYQFGSNVSVGANINLNEGRFLDNIHKGDPKVIQEITTADNSQSYHWNLNDMKATDNYVFNPYDPSYEVRQGTKPYSILWLYEGSTSTFVTYSDTEWREYSDGLAPELNDVAVVSNELILAVGDSDAIYRSPNHGKAWISETGGSSAAFTSVCAPGWATQQVADEIWQRDSNGNWTAINPGWGAFAAHHLEYVNDNFIVAIGTEITDIKMSVYDGSSWTVPALVFGAGLIPSDVSFYDTGNGVVTTNNGIFHTNNGGLSWSNYLPGTAYTACYMPAPNTIIVGDGSGNIERSTAATPSFSTISTTLSTEVSGIDGDGDDVFATTNNGAATVMMIKSEDAGATWTTETLSTSDYFNAVAVNSKVRVAVGGAAGTIWAKT